MVRKLLARYSRSDLFLVFDDCHVQQPCASKKLASGTARTSLGRRVEQLIAAVGRFGLPAVVLAASEERCPPRISGYTYKATGHVGLFEDKPISLLAQKRTIAYGGSLGYQLHLAHQVGDRC